MNLAMAEGGGAAQEVHDLKMTLDVLFSSSVRVFLRRALVVFDVPPASDDVRQRWRVRS